MPGLSTISLAHECSIFFFERKSARRYHTQKSKALGFFLKKKKEKANAREPAAFHQKGTRENKRHKGKMKAGFCALAVLFWSCFLTAEVVARILSQLDDQVRAKVVLASLSLYLHRQIR